MKTFDVKTFDVAKYDNILARGLSKGMGSPNSQMCIEAAICHTLGLPHGDDPHCVASSVRRLKIAINDSLWSSPVARARGMRDLGLAQLGSLGVVGNVEFEHMMVDKTIRILIPKLFRQIFPQNTACLEAATLCEKEGNTYGARFNATKAARAAYAAAGTSGTHYPYIYVIDATINSDYAANSIGDIAKAANADANNADEYLLLCAAFALDILRELKSPGVALLTEATCR